MRKGHAAQGVWSREVITEASPNTICIEMPGLIGAGNNPMFGMTVAVAAPVEEAMK